MSQLGSRLFFYAMPDAEATDAEMEVALVGDSLTEGLRGLLGPPVTGSLASPA